MPNAKPGKAGCLPLLGFLLLEGVVGFTLGYLVASSVWGFLDRAGWINDDTANGLIGIFTGMAVAAIPVFWIDRWCKRLTGESALEQLPLIP
jgi:biotin transporter BioY